MRLVRQVIADSLYNGAGAYFTEGSVVGSQAALKFSSFKGEADYRKAIDGMYAEVAGGWYTPCEIFKPHFQAGLATYVLGETPPKDPLTVVEVGGGTGANAKAFLDHVRAASPEVYAQTSYTIVDISPGLHARQQATCAAHVDAGVLHTACFDATDSAAWRGAHLPAQLQAAAATQAPVFVVLLEVLDNLPHDKVVWDGGLGSWCQTLVEELDGGFVREVTAPVSDETIARALEVFLGYDVSTAPPPIGIRPVAADVVHAYASRMRASITPGGGEESAVKAALRWLLQPPIPPALDLAGGGALPMFLPTGLLLLLDALAANVPGFSVLASDFCSLPPPTAPVQGRHVLSTFKAHNSPLVAGGVDTRQDFETYLCPPPGTADIFFATDFGALAHALHVAGKRPKVWSNAAFHAAHSPIRSTACINGWNPLLSDFVNVGFLTAV